VMVAAALFGHVVTLRKLMAARAATRPLGIAADTRPA